MERIKSINPERIIWCCDDYGITPEELAQTLKIATPIIQRVMDGIDGLTFNQLSKIAEYFGRGVLFFLESGPVDESRAHTTQFRTLANQKPEISARIRMLIKRVEEQREIYLNLCDDIVDSDRPTFNPPEIPTRNPAEAAVKARKWLGLSEMNSFTSYRSAVESQGILVFRSNSYNGKWQIPKENPILGFTLYDPICPVIFIKKLNPETRQSFTLMHELGHLLLHKESSIDDENDLQSHQGRERDANAFAGRVLVPDDFLMKIDNENRPSDVSRYDAWLETQRKTWGVSGEVILRRLLDSGKLPQNQYTAYRQWREHSTLETDTGGNRFYRHREPNHIFGERYVKTVLDAVNSKNITLAKASSYLDDLKIEDLRLLERFHEGL